ncbi:hypothetical protein MLD38_019750 [Melastoma candidum]|uniref:Uncharacterized protein n=1 Tax=Melastoma candidum TaxID=119954 RepID=A0ACB9QZ33_9MYRT|nr:hypothetical protein MLD38_019750 [Melastoma candidum]
MAKPWLPLFHYLPFKSRRANLYYITSVTFLCATFYGLGIWQHSGGISPIISASRLPSTPCITNSSLGGIGKAKDRSSAEAAANNVVTLDFEAHHAADHLIPVAAADLRFPPCDVKLSEYTPCEDVQRSWKFDRDRNIYRERHCPTLDERLRCRIPAPHGYKVPFRWPESRDMAWFANVPHKELTVEKKNQNWVKYEGDRFYFPGGGTMFANGADAYIDDIGKMINLRDGSIRTAIDTGCGVASWGAYLLSRNILTVSFAPRDSHEAQVQFALERGVPALIGVFASKRLPYPARAFDMAHCSRCLIPWGQRDGEFLMEVDRILRPGGYWILSGPPINWEGHWKGWQRTTDDLKAEQDKIEGVARSLCWKKLKQKGDIAIWQKPTNHAHCKENRKVFKFPPFCPAEDPDRAWYTPMDRCLTKLPEVSDTKDTAGGVLTKWPERLTSVPPRIRSGSLEGITAEMFREDTELWKKRVAYYKLADGQLATKGRYRNVLDMNSYLGGFAAALVNDPVWVMNMVPVEASINTLGVIYERGLIGTYQNWCEAMSTYPRTYDFIHGDSVFALYSGRCEFEDIVLEMDRVLRPEGSVIIRDDVDTLVKIKNMFDAMQYESRIMDHEQGPLERHKILWANKQYWTAPAPTEGTSPAS